MLIVGTVRSSSLSSVSANGRLPRVALGRADFERRNERKIHVSDMCVVSKQTVMNEKKREASKPRRFPAGHGAAPQGVSIDEGTWIAIKRLNTSRPARRSKKNPDAAGISRCLLRLGLLKR